VQIVPLLSIAIPTHNRAKYLHRLLAILHEQAVNDSRVEVIVSDNASTDGTRVVVEEFLARGMKFRYVRNPENVGGDNNLLLCYTMCNGRYAWVFGDDDVIAPGALQKILWLLESAEYDLIFLAAYTFPGDSDQFLPSPTLWPAAVNGTSDPLRLVDLVDTHSDLFFITAVIINRQRAKQFVEADLSPYIDDHIVQLGWVLPVLKNLQRGVFVQAQWIGRATLNEYGGFDGPHFCGRRFMNSLDRWLNGDSALVRKMVNNHLTMCLFFLANWIWHNSTASRVHAIEIAEPHKKLVPYYGRNPRYWICVYPLIVLPKALAKAWALPWMVRRKLLRLWYQKITPSIAVPGVKG